MNTPFNASPAPDADFSRMKFLIVDDFQGMRTILRDILRSCGADGKLIATAANGKDAVEVLSNGKYDVVLCDFNLGPGKNGQQILEEAKIRNLIGPACTWIMVTAEKTSDAVTGTAEFQPDAYLLKPITEAVLRQRLAKIRAQKEAFSKIDQAMRRQDYARAIQHCDERLAFDKANASELQRTKADLAMKSGNLALAKQVFDGILAVRDVPWAKAGLAKVLVQGGERANAKALLEETIRESPTFLEAHDMLAALLKDMGEFEAAQQSLERATKLSPNSMTRQKNLGDVALKLGRLDNAERAFRKSVTLGENSALKSPDAYLGLAKTCSAKADPTEALRVLDRLGKTFDDEKVKRQALAVEGAVHHQSGNLKKALEIVGELDKNADEFVLDGPGSLDVARLLLMTGNKEKAIALLQDQVKNSPDNEALLTEVKEIFVGAEMGEEGVHLVESSRKEGMEMMNRGVLLARDGEYEAAIEAMRVAREAMPANARVLFNLAYVILTRIQKSGSTQELLDEARRSLTTANQLSPGQSRFIQLSALLDALSPKT